MIIYIFDLVGTFAFAVSGAFRAVKYELDLLGLTSLSVVTGIGGGITRDLLLGSTPPIVLIDQIYLFICLAAAAIVFLLGPKIAKRWDFVMMADAVGLSVFTAIGADKAESCGAVPITVMLMGMITACGGGVIRDLLVGEIPAVLKNDFYATAALIGSAFFVFLDWVDINTHLRLASVIGVTLCLRAFAVRYRMHLPYVKSLPASPSQLTQQRKAEDKTPCKRASWNKTSANDRK